MHYPHAPHRSNYFTVFREGPWKVVYHYLPAKAAAHGHYQLFNLADDPFEQKDLASSEPQQLRRMMQGLVAALEDHDAVYPVSQDRGSPLKPQVPD